MLRKPNSHTWCRKHYLYPRFSRDLSPSSRSECFLSSKIASSFKKGSLFARRRPVDSLGHGLVAVRELVLALGEGKDLAVGHVEGPSTAFIMCIPKFPVQPGEDPERSFRTLATYDMPRGHAGCRGISTQQWC